jgi:DNA-binding CsgD family transcriptional regulator
VYSLTPVAHDDLSADERRLATLLATPLSLRQIAEILDTQRDEVLASSLELYRKLEI